MGSTKSLKFNEVVSYIGKLSLNSVRVIMDNYAKNHNVSFEAELNHLTMTDFQKRLEAVGVMFFVLSAKQNILLKAVLVTIPSVINANFAKPSLRPFLRPS